MDEEWALRLKDRLKLDSEILTYNGLICISKENVKDILQMAQNDQISGRFGYSNPLARLEKYHWVNKSQDIYYYCRECTK